VHVLEVGGLRKSYGSVRALDGVDLGVAAGEICGLLGPNGAGKTTLVSIVAGLRRADAGCITVSGIDALARPMEARRHLGLAPKSWVST
jgi:ABC-2 type transport system ATP-binding protein